MLTNNQHPYPGLLPWLFHILPGFCHIKTYSYKHYGLYYLNAIIMPHKHNKLGTSRLKFTAKNGKTIVAMQMTESNLFPGMGYASSIGEFEEEKNKGLPRI